jgi:UDP-glucose 4-epimerase
MKAMVTGGAGFIGSHLVERLLQDGHEVVVLDNFSTGRPDNLKHLASAGRLRVVEGDVQDPGQLQLCLQGVDWVFHLAALADIVPSVERPEAYFRSNVDGTFAVLEAVRLSGGVRKFLYAASSSCYGIADTYPTPETAAIRPQYPYALTKNLGEQLVMHWGQLYQIPVLSLRLFNVYGPRSRTSGAYGAVFGVFLAQKLAGQPFTVVGDGAQTRDFIYVTDVARAFLQAAASGLRQEALNVGSGGSYAINQLVGLLGGNVTHLPRRPGEPNCTFADTTKIGMLLGWRPRISFEEGVVRVLEQIEYWRDAPVWTSESIQQVTATWFTLLGGR